MELGDCVKCVHIVERNPILVGELIAWDDDGFITILEGEVEQYIYSGHFHIKKISSLEKELL